MLLQLHVHALQLSATAELMNLMNHLFYTTNRTKAATVPSTAHLRYTSKHEHAHAPHASLPILHLLARICPALHMHNTSQAYHALTWCHRSLRLRHVRSDMTSHWRCWDWSTRCCTAWAQQACPAAVWQWLSTQQSCSTKSWRTSGNEAIGACGSPPCGTERAASCCLNLDVLADCCCCQPLPAPLICSSRRTYQ